MLAEELDQSEHPHRRQSKLISGLGFDLFTGIAGKRGRLPPEKKKSIFTDSP